MHNPIRRSRNIGKTQGGRVKDGKAREKFSRYFTRSEWQKLSVESDGDLKIITENPSRDYYHPCTPDEIREVLERFDGKYLKDLKAVVLRKLPVKDELMGVEARKHWGCIILNAFPQSNRIYWGRKQPAQGQRSHYEPWCENWVNEKGHCYLQWNPEQVKCYYLYHLLLHELGHIIDCHNTAKSRRESFAENFALHWARQFGIIERLA